MLMLLALIGYWLFMGVALTVVAIRAIQERRLPSTIGASARAILLLAVIAVFAVSWARGPSATEQTTDQVGLYVLIAILGPITSFGSLLLEWLRYRSLPALGQEACQRSLFAWLGPVILDALFLVAMLMGMAGAAEA